MSLTLIVQSIAADAEAIPPVAMAGERIAIGRGDANDLVLPDPDRTISSKHCFIEARAGDFVLIDTSTNGTFLNHGPDPVGAFPAPLNHGDVIALGPYQLTVQLAGAEAAKDPFAGIAAPIGQQQISPGVALGPAGADTPMGLPDEPVGAAAGDFLDDLLGPGEGAPAASGHGGLGSGRPVMPADPLGGDGQLIPDDDSIFAPFDEPAHVGASQANHSPSMQDNFAPQAAASHMIPDDWDDDLLGPGGGSDDPFAAPAQTEAQPPIQQPPVQQQPAQQPPVHHAPTQQTHAAQFQPQPAQMPAGQPPPQQPAAMQPSVPQHPPPPSAQQIPQHAPPPQPGAAASNAASRQFFAAMGLAHLNIPDHELDAIMGRLGRVMQIMVTGVREVLMTRASIKSEFRMNQTMIGAGGNNPLKFSISPEQAIEALVRPATQGYLESDAAAQQAMNDIKAHEIAMMTGMEAALKSLLARLDPETLADTLDDGGVSGIFKGSKKAQYWEIYEKAYAKISQEAEDNFQDVFGKAFAKAYEDQLRRL